MPSTCLTATVVVLAALVAESDAPPPPPQAASTRAMARAAPYVSRRLVGVASDARDRHDVLWVAFMAVVPPAGHGGIALRAQRRRRASLCSDAGASTCAAAALMACAVSTCTHSSHASSGDVATA